MAQLSLVLLYLWKERAMKWKVSILMVLLSTSQVYAFDFMGPTTSKLKNSGQPSAALEYFTSDMEIAADDPQELGGLSSGAMKDIEFNKTSANFALGIGGGSEIFLRWGLTEIEPKKGDDIGNLTNYLGTSDERYLIGCGAKWTLINGQKANWGLITQFSWADYVFDRKSYTIEGFDVDFSMDIEIVEVQLAIGPTLQPTENLAIYGGPFLYFLNGDSDLEGLKDSLPFSISADLEQESILCGYIGMQLAVIENFEFNIEYQTTLESHGAGGQIVWRF
jgi:hypothetical protein